MAAEPEIRLSQGRGGEGRGGGLGGAPEAGQQLEDGKGKGSDSSLETPGSTKPRPRIALAQ